MKMSDALRDALVGRSLALQLDEATQKHLDKWLQYCVDANDHLQAKCDITWALREDPTLIERNYTWREIRERGRHVEG